jgi:hypothetical protein
MTGQCMGGSFEFSSDAVQFRPVIVELIMQLGDRREKGRDLPAAEWSHGQYNIFIQDKQGEL